MRRLLEWQRTLVRWAKVRRAPEATPFVSMYVNGVLRGCFGSNEGAAPERLMRAFLRALDDGRFGGVGANDREHLVAQVSYTRNPRLVNPETAADEIEAGVHGVALVREKGRGTLLLPHVARDERIGGADLLKALARKAGLGEADLRDHAMYLFETEDVVVESDSARRALRRPNRDRGTPSNTERIDAAAGFLASLIDDDGVITFAIDPRTRERTAIGDVLHHGRCAVVVQALAAHGKRTAVVDRARRRLTAEVRAGLRGDLVEGFPIDPGLLAGTLAFAILAGAPMAAELRSFVARSFREVMLTPWHAAQALLALHSARNVDGVGFTAGLAAAASEMFAACVADLAQRPWAPWTLLAADARGDRSVRARVARTLAGDIRIAGPYRGGASIKKIPELALTSLAVEALARHPAPWSRAAVVRGRDFIARSQLVGERIYGALDPVLARGAFPASPVVDLLRGDVTGHAILALLAARAPRAQP